MALAVIAIPPLLIGQTPGAVDPSFDSGRFSLDGTVRAVSTSSGEKCYVGGSFSIVNGERLGGLVRLNPDGTLDEAFDPGYYGLTGVDRIVEQPDGKVVVGGLVLSYNLTRINGIARINANGSLDTTFTSPLSSFAFLDCIALQSDGKMVVAGTLSGLWYQTFIRRLNANGTVDQSFESSIDFANAVVASARTITVQADGKLLVGGSSLLHPVSGSRSGLLRLHGNGDIDSGFACDTQGSIAQIVEQPDGRLLVGGYFSAINGVARNNIARLNADGSIDASFDPGVGFDDEVKYLRLLADGSVIVSGEFTAYNGVPRERVARLTANGGLDLNFEPVAGLGDSAARFDSEQFAAFPDGSVIVGGSFTSFGGEPRTGLGRLLADGSIDAGFDVDLASFSNILDLSISSDPKAIVSGSFSKHRENPINRLGRFGADGEFDVSFDPGEGPDSFVYGVAQLQSGKMLVGGSFGRFDGIAREGIARLQKEGGHDASFDTGGTRRPSIEAIALQPDGKTLIGGGFTRIGNVDLKNLARLNQNGTVDSSFDPGGSADSWIDRLALQPDGKVLIGGIFSKFNGVPRRYIARLNSNGSLDSGFDPGSGPSVSPESILVQPDGRILIGGSFTTYNGASRNRIARLNADGSLDLTFDCGSGANGAVRSIGLQADGKVLVSGDFTLFDGAPRQRIARLNPDGSLDLAFLPGTSDIGTAWSLALRADGSVLVGCAASDSETTGESLVLRLGNNPAIQSLVASDSNRVEWQRGGSAPEVNQVDFQTSVDGTNWTSLGFGTRISGGWELTGLTLTGSRHLRAVGFYSSGSGNRSTSMVEQIGTYNFPPEISVEGGGVEIESGDDSPSSSDLTDFGVVNWSGQSVSRDFTIGNSGDGVLSLTGTPVVEIDGSPAFEVTRQPSSALLESGGGTESFEITFDPSTAGFHSAMVTILNDDADEETYTFTIGGASPRAVQQITFNNPGDRLVSGGFPLEAIGGGSSQPVVFNVVSGPAVIENGWVRFTGNGVVVLSAGQQGDQNYESATLVEQTFMVVLPRPDVAVGASPARLTGLGVYFPAQQTANLRFSRRKTANGCIGLFNRVILPDNRAADRIVLKGTGDNSRFRASYRGLEGNLTASVIAGSYRTSLIDGDDPVVVLRVAISSKRKPRAGSRQNRQPRRDAFTVQLSATSLGPSTQVDRASIRVF